MADLNEVMDKIAALRAADRAGRIFASDTSVELAKVAGVLFARGELVKEAGTTMALGSGVFGRKAARKTLSAMATAKPTLATGVPKVTPSWSPSPLGAPAHMPGSQGTMAPKPAPPKSAPKTEVMEGAPTLATGAPKVEPSWQPSPLGAPSHMPGSQGTMAPKVAPAGATTDAGTVGARPKRVTPGKQSVSAEAAGGVTSAEPVQWNTGGIGFHYSPAQQARMNAMHQQGIAAEQAAKGGKVHAPADATPTSPMGKAPQAYPGEDVWGSWTPGGPSPYGAPVHKPGSQGTIAPGALVARSPAAPQPAYTPQPTPAAQPYTAPARVAPPGSGPGIASKGQYQKGQLKGPQTIAAGPEYQADMTKRHLAHQDAQYQSKVDAKAQTKTDRAEAKARAKEDKAVNQAYTNETGKPAPGQVGAPQASQMPGQAGEAAGGAAEAATAPAKGGSWKGKALMYGGLGLGAYGLMKGVPWAARQLETAGAGSMAYGGGWSPTPYGYGYTPYGPGAPGAQY